MTGWEISDQFFFFFFGGGGGNTSTQMVGLSIVKFSGGVAYIYCFQLFGNSSLAMENPWFSLGDTSI